MTLLNSVRRLLIAADFARAYTLAVLTVVFSAFAIERLAGTVTLTTIVAMLCVVGAIMLFLRRDELAPLRVAPTTLIVFLLVTLASVFWSTDAAQSLRAWLGLFALAFLAIAIGNVRDTLQTVRALGDVLRVLLSVSLGLEILTGILLDTGFAALDMQGAIAYGGPVQGIFGTRNMLGFVAVIALITFVVEARSRSVSRGVAAYGIVLAGALAALSASPTVLVLAVCVGVATIALRIVRHTSPARRGLVQWILGGLVVLALAAALLLRHQIIRLLDAGSDFSLRGDLWNTTLDFIAVQPLHGWGWFGQWAGDEFPFRTINFLLGEGHRSALNAYFDLTLQVGVVGLVAFFALGGVALVRSWLVATARRSVMYAWTPLVLVTLATDSMFESFTLVGTGWFLLALCALRAGQSRSWRESIDAAQTGVIPTLSPRK